MSLPDLNGPWSLDNAPILQGNEGMRGPLLAEAKAVLRKVEEMF